MDWGTCPAVERNPGKSSVAWAFTGTRVPLHALFENLASGATIDEFVEWFPGVRRAAGSGGAGTRSKGVKEGAGPLKLLFDQGTPLSPR